MQGSQQFGSMTPQQGSMPSTMTMPMPQIHLGQGGQNQMSMSPGTPGSLPHIQGYQYGGSGFPTAGGNFSQMGGFSSPQPTQNWQGWPMSSGQQGGMPSPFQTSNLPYNLPSGGSDGQNMGVKGPRYTLDGKVAASSNNMNPGAQSQTWTSSFQGSNGQSSANMLPTGNYSFNMPRNGI